MFQQNLNQPIENTDKALAAGAEHRDESAINTPNDSQSMASLPLSDRFDEGFTIGVTTGMAGVVLAGFLAFGIREVADVETAPVAVAQKNVSTSLPDVKLPSIPDEDLPGKGRFSDSDYMLHFNTTIPVSLSSEERMHFDRVLQVISDLKKIKSNLPVEMFDATFDIKGEINKIAPNIRSLSESMDDKAVQLARTRAGEWYKDMSYSLRSLLKYHQDTSSSRLSLHAASGTRIEVGRIIAELEQHALYDLGERAQFNAEYFAAYHPNIDTALPTVIPHVIRHLATAQMLLKERGNNWASLNTRISDSNTIGEQLPLTVSHLQRCLNTHGYSTQRNRDECHTLFVKLQNLLDHEFRPGFYTADYRRPEENPQEVLTQLKRELEEVLKAVRED